MGIRSLLVLVLVGEGRPRWSWCWLAEILNFPGDLQERAGVEKCERVYHAEKLNGVNERYRMLLRTD
jgi:hypothetical protein